MTDDSSSADLKQPDSVPPRRSFLAKALAVLIGGFLMLVPLATGFAVFLDPLRSRKKSDDGGGEEEEGFIKVASLDELAVGEDPQRYKVIDDRVDAWNMFPQEPVGAIYLLRQSESEVLAFNADCPHATCPVSFSHEKEVYQCPCHNSSFFPTGGIANPSSPAARGLDRLTVKIKNDNEVWVHFENFQPGIAEKIPLT